MIFRKLTATGDYSYGSNAFDFYVDIDAVAQAIQTRLQLYQGGFWRDLSDGLPLYQSILATSGSPDNLAAVSNFIQDRIKGTPGVEGIVAFDVIFDPNTRQYAYSATVQTTFSTTIVSGAL